MAKAGLLYVGTEDGIVLYSEPGAMGRWLRVGHELRGRVVTSLWAWSVNPLTVVACAGGQLVRSVDGGASWSEIGGVQGGVLAGSKGSAVVVCLAPDGTLASSQDAGETWARAGAIGTAGATHMAAAPDNPQTLLAGTGSRAWVSINGGADWTDLGELPGPIQGLLVAVDETGREASYYAAARGLFGYVMGRWMEQSEGPLAIGALAKLPGRELTVLATIPGGLVCRSLGRWNEWESAGAEISWPEQAPTTLVVAPYHLDTAFAGGGSAVALTTDRGKSWQRLKGELPAVQSLAVARLV
jgi:hypothetical protein